MKSSSSSSFSTTLTMKIFISALFVLLVVEKGLGLRCIKCASTDVYSKCRYGRKSGLEKVWESCYGRKVRCYAITTVSESGEAYLERGCTDYNVCTSSDDPEPEYCMTCLTTFCNYNIMKLDEEIDLYFLENNHLAMQNDTSEKSTTTETLPSATYQAPDVDSSSKTQNDYNSTTVAIFDLLKDQDIISTSTNKNSIHVSDVSSNNSTSVPTVQNTDVAAKEKTINVENNS